LARSDGISRNNVIYTSGRDIYDFLGTGEPRKLIVGIVALFLCAFFIVVRVTVFRSESLPEGSKVGNDGLEGEERN